MNKKISVDQLLQELEKDSITSRERADILIKIINIESAKSEEEADMDLIQECIEFFNLLSNREEEIEAQKDQMHYRLQQIYQRAAEDDTSKNTIIRKRRFRSIGLAAAVFVAILLIMVTSLTVIARVNGYNSTLEWIYAHLNQIFQSDRGEENVIDGITVIREAETKNYPDIESWLQEENLDILYPSILPDGVSIDRIFQSTRGAGEVRIIFTFNTPDVRLLAQNYDLDHYEITEDMEVIEVNGYCFGILSTPDGGYQAYCTFDNTAYDIVCSERDTLLTLINAFERN